MIFNYKNITPESLNKKLNNTLASHLGMEISEIGKDYVIMKMPVDSRTKQYYGILNGGASLALAETVGSIASNLAVNFEKRCIGLEINGNHLKAVSEGFVYAKATPVHIGKSTHVWQVFINDEKENLICICRLTMAIFDKKD